MANLSESLKCAVEAYAKQQNVFALDDLKVTRASQNGDSFAADVLRISVAVLDKDENGNNALEAEKDG